MSFIKAVAKKKSFLIPVLVVLVLLLIVFLHFLKIRDDNGEDLNNINNANSEMSYLTKEVRDGDIVLQMSDSNYGKAVQLVTKSKYNQMGIIFFRDGNPFVLEAAPNVKFTPLDEWIYKGLDGRYVVERVMDYQISLTDKVMEKMKKTADRFLGKSYDFYFGWSDEAIYCSELVWKIYKEGAGIELTELHKLKEFDLSSESVQKRFAEKYGSDIPMNEPVVSPIAIFHSKYLYAVMSNLGDK